MYIILISGSIYTFTNSTVLHPEDPMNVTSSVMSSRVATAPSSAMNSGMNTPRILSRRNSTTTFSTTLGLAKMLNERGIKGVTPSCMTTPCNDRNFTPTATPYNSPDGTPPQSRSSSPDRLSRKSKLHSSKSNDEASSYSLDYSFGLFSTGAELLKRTFGTDSSPSTSQQKQRKRKPALSRSEKKALTSIRLVEKLERIGIDTIMATAGGSSSMSSLALQGALCTRRSIESPMAQLTFLKGSISSSSISTASSDSLASSRAKKDQKENPGGGGGYNRGSLSRTQSARRRGGNGATRPDLGQVNSAVNVPVTKESTRQSALGTISSLLFGRKGGLL